MVVVRAADEVVWTALLQHTATHCDTLRHTATHCNTLRHTATHCDTLQHSATQCNTVHHSTTQCITVQHTATHCNTLQHKLQNTATHSCGSHHQYLRLRPNERANVNRHPITQNSPRKGHERPRSRGEGGCWNSCGSHYQYLRLRVCQRRHEGLLSCARCCRVLKCV